MSFVKKYLTLNRIVGAIMIFLISIIVFTLLWSIDKGIDLADEGLHFVFSKPETVNNNGLFNYDLFFKLLYKAVQFDFDIISLRIIKLVSIVLLFILGIPFFRRSKLSIIDNFFLAMAIFCSYTYLTQSLSYNSISFVLVLSYFYCYSYMIKATLFRQNTLFLLMAILSSLCYFVKPPLSLALFGMTFILSTMSFTTWKWKQLLFRFLLIFVGYVAIQGLFQFIFSNYSFAKVLKDSMELSTYYGSYNKSVLIKRVVASFKWVFVLSLAGWCIAVLINKGRNNFKAVILSLFVIGVSLSYFFVSHLSSNEFDIFQYGLMIIASIGLGFFGYHLKWNNLTKQDIGILILLFLAPFLCSFGSNVYFFRTTQQYLFFWVLLLVYAKNIGLPFSKNILLSWYLIFSVFITIKIYNNVLENPDNQPQLSPNFVDFKYGNDNHINLDKHQAQYLIHLKEKLHKWSPNRKEIIGLYAMPGDIALTGYTNYYNPLIWDNFQWNFLRNRMLTNSEFKDKPMPILITKDLDKIQRQQLKGYLEVDSVKYYRNGYIYLLKPL
jgi:hypothetical protein